MTRSTGNLLVTLPENHNNGVVMFQGLAYDRLRTKQVRSHNRIYHKYAGKCPPLHIPVELDGVVP